MVIHNQGDWRTPEQALQWDTALVRSVFCNICKRYDEQAEAKAARQAKQSHVRAKPASPDNNQLDERENREQETREHKFDEHRLVAKADVMIGIKTTERYLEKRPFLRSLVTILACCSNEKEMESVGNYVKYRLRERTISFVTVRDKLQEIYRKHIDLLAFEAKVEEFKAAARAKSTWCVRDPKSICKRPSQFYGVHDIPPKPKTQKEIEVELQLIKTHATAIANNAISLVLSQLVEAARPISRQWSVKSSRDNRSQTSTKAKAAVKAKQKRDQQQADARRKELRLQVLVPGIAHTRHSTTFGCLATTSEGMDEVEQRRSQHAKQLEFLALMEANGDKIVAEQLIQQLIPRSGFMRVAEHLANLGGSTQGGKADEAPDEWTVFKLWKTVYRNRTLQSIQRLEQ